MDSFDDSQSSSVMVSSSFPVVSIVLHEAISAQLSFKLILQLSVLSSFRDATTLSHIMSWLFDMLTLTHQKIFTLDCLIVIVGAALFIVSLIFTDDDFQSLSVTVISRVPAVLIDVQVLISSSLNLRLSEQFSVLSSVHETIASFQSRS